MSRITGWLGAQAPRIDWVIRVVGTVGFVALVLLYSDFRSYVDCQATYNEINNERTRILTEVGQRERDAERARNDALDATFLDPSLLKPASQRTPEEARRVQELYLAYRTTAETLRVERVTADQARAQNPVPRPPSSICG